MTVLVVDDEKNIRGSIARYLGLEGIEAVQAENGLSAQRLLEERAFSAAVVDLKMPGMDGLELLRWIRERGPGVPVLMISAHGEIQDAVEAMKLGAEDYVVKPFDPEELAIRLRRIIDETRLRAQVEAGRRDSKSDRELIGESAAMQRIRVLIDKVAATPSTVLITGESGVGKEVVAHAIHRRSGESDGPFVPVNIGGVPASLLESELFGHEKGAFTGASAQKQGLFELAAHGTLFLDEVGEMSGELQVKLLRVIQDRKIRRLGATRLLPVDTRIMAATNRDLEQDVKSGSFREDLYYRLNVVRIRIPPLRERPEDIPELTGHFIERLNRRMGTQVRGVTPEALAALQAYPWPGNIRELENAVERALIFTDSDLLSPRDLDVANYAGPREGVRAGEGAGRLSGGAGRLSGGAGRLSGATLKQLEREAIREALQRWEGNRTRAAEQLGITRRTLFNKIREYGFDEGER